MTTPRPKAWSGSLSNPPFYYVPGIHPHSITGVETYEGAAACYAKLWDHIHAKPGMTWADNPKVYRIEFYNVVPRQTLPSEAPA